MYVLMSESDKKRMLSQVAFKLCVDNGKAEVYRTRGMGELPLIFQIKSIHKDAPWMTMASMTTRHTGNGLIAKNIACVHSKQFSGAFTRVIIEELVKSLVDYAGEDRYMFHISTSDTTLLDVLMDKGAHVVLSKTNATGLGQFTTCLNIRREKSLQAVCAL